MGLKPRRPPTARRPRVIPDNAVAAPVSEPAILEVPEPEATVEEVAETIKIRGYKGDGQAALAAAALGLEHTPKVGSPIDLEVEGDTDSVFLVYRQLSAIDFDGFSALANLKELNVGGNLITAVDLGPLARCESLESLSLSGNRISEIDLSPLASCTKLRNLHLFGNPLRTIDASPLAGCPSFETLIVDGGAEVQGLAPERVNKRG